MKPNSYSEFIEQITLEGLESLGLFYSAYRGSVIANDDPMNIGRLKIKCPAIYGDDEFGDWVIPKGVPAGLGAGIFWLPNAQDPIYISCEAGDPSHPLWEYGWWLKDKTPSGAEPKVYSFVTPDGHRVDLRDKDNTVKVSHKDGFHVKLFSDGFYIGKDDQNIGKLFSDLFDLFADTTVATPGGPAPFNNVLDYANLKTQMLQFIKTS